jgi:hypothetical protein
MGHPQTTELRRLSHRKRVDDELVLCAIAHLAILSDRLDKIEKELTSDRLRGHPGGD